MHLYCAAGYVLCFIEHVPLFFLFAPFPPFVGFEWKGREPTEIHAL